MSKRKDLIINTTEDIMHLPYRDSKEVADIIKECVKKAEKLGEKKAKKSAKAEKPKKAVESSAAKLSNAETISVSRDKFKNILIKSLRMDALEAGGVDNWSYYGEALCDELTERGFCDFEDMAESLVDTYHKEPTSEDLNIISEEPEEEMER